MTALDPQETMAQVMEHLMQEEEVGRCLLQLVEDEWNVRKVEHLYIIHHYGLDEKRHLTREELIKLSRWVATDDRVKG